MDRRWPLIGIAGLATAGKDAVASRLTARWGFVRIGFADALKIEVKQKFPRTLLAAWTHSAEGGEIPNDSAARAAVLDMLVDTKPPIVRALLQEYGTEVRRADDDDYWITAWLDTAGQNWDRRIVVPDLRFQNEADTIRRWGMLIKVVRSGVQGAGSHSSETGVAAWPDSTFDWVARNDGTLADLWAQVDDWVARQYDRWR